MSDITIGFVPRERFSLAAEALQRIFDHTEQPFDMIVVDCNIPPVYRQEMDQVLEGRDNVRIIQRDRYLLPNQSKNLVVAEAKGEWLCMIENDVLVQDGWLSTLIAACEEHPADVAVPLIERALDLGVNYVDTSARYGGVEQRWSELVYDGLWFSPLRRALDTFIDEASVPVSGDIRMIMQGGRAVPTGRRSSR